MPRVLIISYYFPPAGGPGVQRVLSFTRHLPKCGWDPVVLTVKDGTFFNRDEDSLKDVPPDVPVYRAPTLEPYALYNRLRGRPTDEMLPVYHVGESGGWRGRFSRFVRANLFIPDARIGWFPFAVRAARRIVVDERIDAILTSSPPQTAQLVGMRVARRTGLPWVADFRDPWTHIFYNADLPKTALVRSLDYRLEQSCVNHATRMTVVNEMVRGSLGPAARDATIISNGFEADLFEEDVIPANGRLVILFVGNLQPANHTETFFRVLGREVTTSEDLARALSLVFVGTVHPATLAELRSLGLTEFCDFKGFRPHREAIRLLRSATVALFIGVGGILGTKIFEYAATGLPILPIAPVGGDVDRFLASVDAHTPGRASADEPHVVDHRDESGIRSRVRSLFGAWRTGSLTARHPLTGVRHLTRESLTATLAEVLNEAMREGGR